MRKKREMLTEKGKWIIIRNMKTSKKILLATTGFLLAFLIVGLFILRNDMKTILKQSALKYESVKVDYFEELEFKGNWSVRVKPGRSCKIDLEIKEDRDSNLKFENQNGKQYLILKNGVTLHARVTVPLLKKLIVNNSTKVHIEDYPADSIWIELRDSASYSGKNNQFKYVSFKSSGETSVQISEPLK